MRIIDAYLVVGVSLPEAKRYIDNLNLDWDAQTVNYYRIDGLEFRFATIEQLKNGSLRGKKKFLYSLCSRHISLGDYHDFIRPLTKKDKFTVF